MFSYSFLLTRMSAHSARITPQHPSSLHTVVHAQRTSPRFVDVGLFGALKDTPKNWRTHTKKNPYKPRTKIIQKQANTECMSL